MLKVSSIILIVVASICVLFSVNYASPSGYQRQQKNEAPVVKIITPKNNSSFDDKSLVNYSITVSDRDDGESKFDEINVKEILLEVKSINDESKLAVELNKADQEDPRGLEVIRTSNCFNCHGFDTKVIGPSFNDIGKRYKPTSANMALLQKRISEGSKGVWGKVPMPTHPELTTQQTSEMVKWIMQITSDPTVHYYIGSEGPLHLNNPNNSKTAACILTASYTDHGLKEDSTHRLKGQDIIMIRTH